MRRASILPVLLVLVGLTEPGAAVDPGCHQDVYAPDCYTVVVAAGYDGYDLGLYYADASGTARAVRGAAGGCDGCEWQLTLACPGNRPVSPGDVVRGEVGCARAVASCPAGLLQQVWLRRPGERWVVADTICLSAGGRLTNLRDLATDVAAAFRRLPLPEPALRRQPPGDAVVGIPTVFFARPEPARTVELRVDGFAVELTATPARWDWAFDDGDAGRSTADPGRPHPDATVTHVYRRAGAVTPAVTCEWHATFAVAGVPGVRVPVAERVRRSAAVSLRVREARAELVAGS